MKRETFVYIANFTLMRAGPFAWYFAPLLPVLYFSICLGAHDLVDEFKKLNRFFHDLMMRNEVGLVVLVALLIASAITAYQDWELEQLDGNLETQVSKPIGLWLKENTFENSTVALESIGAVGWYSNRYILDEGGLISTKTLALNKQLPGTINSIGILQTYIPDYYFAWRDWELVNLLEDSSARAWFNQNYQEVKRFSEERTTWVLFRHREHFEGEN